MKFVYYGKYFEYFEQGRSDLLRSLGLPYSAIEKQGIYLPVIEAYARYRQSARYDDLISVETIVTEMPTARIRIDYKVFRNTEADLLVEGYTVHSFVHADTGRPARPPSEFIRVLEDAFKKSKE
jgi:acyl-CoA thioester hydrolase